MELPILARFRLPTLFQSSFDHLAEVGEQSPREMSVPERAYNQGSHNQYIGQRAGDCATQILGNVGTVYSSPPRSFAQDCMTALWLTDPLEDRKNLIDMKGPRVSGTCEWIRTNETYLSWLRSCSQLLWLSGGPGKGKTMLSIFLAEELEQIARESHDSISIQYFCDNKDEKRNTAVAVLRGLVFELLRKCEKLMTHILPTFQILKENLFTDSSFGTLWTCFESMVCDPSFRHVYCVIDGLDECSEASSEILLKRFRTLFSPNTNLPSDCHLNLIAVSREKPDFVARELSDFPRIRLGPDADTDIDCDVNSDIGKFITAKVDELSRYRNYTPELRSYVEDIFHEHAEGTFLWIGIVAKELERYTCDEVKNALKEFPVGLHQLYGRMLLQFPSHRRETIATILRWVVMAVKPLTLSELSTAIGNTVETSFGLSCEEVMLEQVRNCGHLLTMIDARGRQKVNLVHQSVKDYLLRETCDPMPELEFFRIKKDAANLEIAKHCLDYLQSGSLAEGEVDSHREFRRLKEFPLLEYAVCHWNKHARCLSDPNLDIFDLSHPFYAETSLPRESWLSTYWHLMIYAPRPRSFTLLHIASYFGIVPLAKKLLYKRRWRKYLGLVINKKDSDGMTALHRAAQVGNEALVRLLLSNGADTKAKVGIGRTVLHLAEEGRNEAVIQLLLEKGWNPKVKDRRGRTVLHDAARTGHRTVVQLLLEKGADLEAKDNEGRTALHFAAGWGHDTVVQLLVEKGADPKATYGEGYTVLHDAVRRANETTVELLIKKGADPKAKTAGGATLLHCAVKGSNEAVIRLLLEKGADLNAEDNDRTTPLHWMVVYSYGNEVIAQLLLEKGADPQAAGQGWK